MEQAVAWQILLGWRESLTIAGQLGRPVEVVNEALTNLRDACDGCIALTRPYPDEHGDSAYNAGDGPLVLWLANLHTAGEPVLTMMDMATPMP